MSDLGGELVERWWSVGSSGAGWDAEQHLSGHGLVWVSRQNMTGGLKLSLLTIPGVVVCCVCVAIKSEQRITLLTWPDTRNGVFLTLLSQLYHL